jgi:hypothetical protein
MISTRLGIAVEASAMLPDVTVVHALSGISISWHEVEPLMQPCGGVIVLIAAVPPTCTICPVGAIVEAEAIGPVSPIRTGGPFPNDF